MGRPQRRKKCHKGDKPLKAKYCLQKRTKDLDEIHVDMGPEQMKMYLNQQVDYDKPGNAQFYCVHCARYFVSNESLEKHFKSKFHKRRMKLLGVEPYTQKEAERAAGMGSYVAPAAVNVIPQPKKDVVSNMDISQMIGAMDQLKN